MAATPNPEPAPKPVVPEVVPTPPEPPAPEKSEPEEVPSLAIVLVGSPKGMEFYRLAEPPGIGRCVYD